MASIKFFLQSTKSPAGIYVRLRDGKAIDAKAKTRYSINPADWSTKKGQPKNLKDIDFKNLNKDLVDFSNDLLAHYNSSVGKVITNSNWLKEFISPAAKEILITENLIEYFDFYKEHKKADLMPNSLKKIVSIKHLLQRFQDSLKKDILIKNVDLSFKLEFEKYCINNGYSHNTIARAVIFIKSVCLHAKTMGVPAHTQITEFEVKYKTAINIYLNPDELKMIEKAKFDSEYLDNTRDWLLISCETGQRVSDFMQFNRDKVRIENGKHLIEFTQVKTGTVMGIPLSKKVLSILKKRKGDFPRQISDQKYNEYVKEVCRLSGLTKKIKGSRKDPETNRKETGTFEKWELVSSHIGRRSFATNNYGRVPTSILKYMTGHSTEKMFLEYIGKTQTETALQAAEYF